MDGCVCVCVCLFVCVCMCVCVLKDTYKFVKGGALHGGVSETLKNSRVKFFKKKEGTTTTFFH